MDKVYIVTSTPCDMDGNSKLIVKVFSDELRAEEFRDKILKEDKKLQEENGCDPTEYEVEEWTVE